MNSCPHSWKRRSSQTARIRRNKSFFTGPRKFRGPIIAEKQVWWKRKNRRWRVNYKETWAVRKVLLDFFQKSRDWKGHEPRCPDFIWTPEKPLAGRTAWPAFPASGKPRFFTGCTPIFRCSASSTFPEGDNLRKLWFRALHEMRAMPYGPQTIF